jgi:hypothetical protein
MFLISLYISMVFPSVSWVHEAFSIVLRSPISVPIEFIFICSLLSVVNDVLYWVYISCLISGFWILTHLIYFLMLVHHTHAISSDCNLLTSLSPCPMFLLCMWKYAIHMQASSLFLNFPDQNLQHICNNLVKFSRPVDFM